MRNQVFFVGGADRNTYKVEPANTVHIHPAIVGREERRYLHTHVEVRTYSAVS